MIGFSKSLGSRYTKWRKRKQQGSGSTIRGNLLNKRRAIVVPILKKKSKKPKKKTFKPELEKEIIEKMTNVIRQQHRETW